MVKSSSFVLRRAVLAVLLAQPVCGRILVAEEKKFTGHLQVKAKEQDRRLQMAEVAPEMDSPEYWALVEQQKQQEMEGASVANQFTQFEQTVDDTTLICEGTVMMNRLKCPEDACDVGSSCTGCSAYFCQVDFDLQKENPEKYPSLMDLVGASPHCDSRSIKMDFDEIVRTCKKYDQVNVAQLPKSLPLTGLITELGNTDSDLVTNALAGTMPNTHVLVEPQPVKEAMTMCNDYRKGRTRGFKGVTTTCNKDNAAALLQDVVYLLSRTRDANEDNVMLKVSPDAVGGLDVFQAAYPDVKILAVYDRPAEALGAQMGRFKPERAECMTTRKDPPPSVELVAQRTLGKPAKDLTTEQYCAAVLAARGEYVLAASDNNNNQNSKFGRTGGKVTVAASSEEMNKLFAWTGKDKRRGGVVTSLIPKNEDGVADPTLQDRRRKAKLAKASPKLEEAAVAVYGDIYMRLQAAGSP